VVISLDESYEIELKCLAGKPIGIDNNLKVHKVSLSAILDLGYYNYNNMIQTLCMDNAKMSQILNIKDVDVYKYIISISEHVLVEKRYENISFFYSLIDVLSNIFKESVTFNPIECNFKIGKNGILQRSNFNDFQQVLKIRNCLINVETDEDNPDSERTRQLLERRKQLREKINKSKQGLDENESITLFDLISIYAEAEQMKLEDVFEYDLFQFNNQFNRLKIFMDYDVNIRALLAGAKKEDVDLQHWLCKINKTE
jgi:hypothetical protein